MNDTKIASKAKAQLSNFMGKVFTHFSKPTRKFIEECIYGIQASGNTKLSSIVRAIDDDIRPIYTEKRLSRNLDNTASEESIAQAILNNGANPGIRSLFHCRQTQTRVHEVWQMDKNRRQNKRI